MKRISLFVPGRLCLFGEHSDWAGLQRVVNADILPGKAIVSGLEQGIFAEVEKADSFSMHNIAPELCDTWVNFECQMNTGSLKRVLEEDGYFSYVAGVASYINENYRVGGLKVTITKMTLPMKSGLSSSAAICVLIARAFNLLYELRMSTMGEMLAAYRGEQRTKSRCGRLDQACAFGIAPVSMDFDGEEIDVERLVVKEPLHWVFAHLKAHKDTIKILADLNRCYPFASNEDEQAVHEALGPDNLEIVEQAIAYIRNGKKQALGKLMTEAQALFDKKIAPMSYEQLRAPKLHQVLEDETVKSLSYGGKGVGSQGDGSVQFLAKDAKTQQKLIEYLEHIGLDAYSLTIPSQRQIRKAIIPVAGFGTRLFPATHGIKKEFLPIIDRDNQVKPVILLLLEQLVESGIESICLVVGSREDIDFYHRYFNEPLQEAHRKKLPSPMRAYADWILSIGKRLTFCIQKEKKGFGHAVYQCRDFCENEAVLLLLGDTVYRSNTVKPCSLQLIEEFEKVNRPMVSIHKISPAQAVHYGVLSGVWENREQSVMKVNQFVEKPLSEYAKDDLSVEKKDGSKNIYGVFGQYILTPEVFGELETIIAADQRKDGEIQLTDALSAMIEKCGLAGVLLDGKMFDIGNAESYKKAMEEYRDEPAKE